MVVRERAPDVNTDEGEVEDPPPAPNQERAAEPGGRSGWAWPDWATPNRLADMAAVVCYLAAALVVFAPLWTDLGRGYLANSMQDQNMWEWFFAVTARNVVHLDNPLFSALQNAPAGVNMMANTALLGVSIPLTPVTLLFGPTVTWAIVLTGGLAGTAAAWYWLLSRYVVSSRLAAALGGAFCGFAPSMVSHANAHPNFVVLFVIPFIVARLIRLAGGARPVRDGVILGLLVAYQVFLGEEPLLIAATAVLVFGIAYFCFRPSAARTMVRPLLVGLGIGGAVCLVLVAYPLWWQFFGPQGYRSLEHGSVGNDLAAMTTFSSDSIGGDAGVASGLSINPTEENAFFGWPLIVLVVVIAVLLWRAVLARALVITAFVMAVLSFGVELVVHGEPTGIPGPWLLIAKLPLYESVIESRMALACVPVIGVLIALASQHVIGLVRDSPTHRTPFYVVWFGALVAVLLPIAPTPLKVIDRAQTPLFFTDGTWRDYVGPGRTVVTVPLPDPGYARALHWQVEAGLGFPLAEGYFLGPDGPERAGTYGAVRRPTSKLLQKVADNAQIPEITDQARNDLVADLHYWRADVLVLPPHKNQKELAATLDLLLGQPGQRVDGVLVWDVRGR